jgi:hypothetical protein
MFWTRRTGHLSNEELSAYLDGELPAARLTAAAGHLAGCDQCSAALDALRQTAALVSRLPQVEAPRSFTLTPAMAGSGQRRPQQPQRRPQLVFVPAVALTLLVALFAVDLASSGLSSNSSDEAGTASQAMVTKDASSSAESAAGGAAADSSRQSFGAQVTPQAALPAQPPSTSGPGTSPSTAPEQQPLQATAPAAPTAPQLPPTTGGPTTGSAPAPDAAAPDAKAGGVTSEAAPAPAPASANATDSLGADDGASLRNTGHADDGGPDWLRLAEALTAIVFVASLAYLFGPRLFKKGP